MISPVSGSCSSPLAVRAKTGPFWLWTNGGIVKWCIKGALQTSARIEASVAEPSDLGGAFMQKAAAVLSIYRSAESGKKCWERPFELDQPDGDVTLIRARRIFFRRERAE